MEGCQCLTHGFVCFCNDFFLIRNSIVYVGYIENRSGKEDKGNHKKEKRWTHILVMARDMTLVYVGKFCSPKMKEVRTLYILLL